MPTFIFFEKNNNYQLLMQIFEMKIQLHKIAEQNRNKIK